MENSTQKINDHRRSVKEWLALPFQWNIPVYQRHYSWDPNEKAGPINVLWETIKEQTEKRLQRETHSPHYLGAVLVDNKTKDNQLDGITHHNVVDGQQRLTTIQLALLALIEVTKENSLDLDKNQPEKLKEDLNKYIFLGEKVNPKLNPTNFDLEQYKAVVEHVYGEKDLFGLKRNSISEENQKKSKVVQTFNEFKEKFKFFIIKKKNDESREGSDIINFLKDTLLDGFDLVLIVLKKTDKAQKIFESLNNTAKPLTTFDLIRNNVFYRADKEQEGRDKELFDSDLWQLLEQPYWEEKATKQKGSEKNHIEAYIERMLMAKLKDKNIKFNRNDIFKSYKNFAEKYEKNGGVETEIESMTEYIEIYQYLASKKLPEQDLTIKEINFGVFFYVIWNNRDFYPLFFLILKSELEKQEKQKMIDLLESYVIRRGVCGLSNENYNLLVANTCQEIGNNISYQKLYDHLIKFDNKSNKFPNNDEVKQGCIHENFYKSKIKNYIFRQIEYSLPLDPSMQETNIKEDLEVDHIIPQAWKKEKKWEKQLLESSSKSEIEPEFEVNTNINTIGNLTIMSKKRNLKKSNHSFDEIRPLLKGSNLKLNRELAEKEKWGITEVHERSSELAKIICGRWTYEK